LSGVSERRMHHSHWVSVFPLFLNSLYGIK
jgi:hypothetical protein